MTKKKISIIIPARLKSSRFPNKVLVKILGLPMIEHVRRRALMSKYVDNVIVATPDLKIQKIIKKNNGLCIKTYKHHISGTSRVAEACKQIDSSHIIILQGDEPLIKPKEIDSLIKKMINSKSKIFNCIGNITKSELTDKSVVKAIIDKNKNICSCFRDYNNNYNQKNYKLFGVMGFEKEILLKLMNLKPSKNEKKYKIEQLRIIDNKFLMKSFLIKGTSASVNFKKDLITIKKDLKNDKNQNKIFNKIIV